MEIRSTDGIFKVSLEGRPTITNLSDITDDSTQELQFSDETESSRANATPGPSSFTVRTPTPSPSSVRTPTPSSSSVRTPTPTSSSNRNKKGNEDNFVSEMVNVIKSSQEARQKRMSEMDETDYFFLSMSKQLQKLPEIDQADSAAVDPLSNFEVILYKALCIKYHTG